jgi:hypothetical protein
MNSKNSRSNSRRSGHGRRRAGRESWHKENALQPAKQTLWQKFLSLFVRKKAQEDAAQEVLAPASGPPTEMVEVTSPRLYVGNLNYSVEEDELRNLFNGAGYVMEVEIAADPETYQSKGYGYVTMMTTDEARRAVEKLHDKGYLGRRLVVTGVKADA